VKNDSAINKNNSEANKHEGLHCSWIDGEVNVYANVAFEKEKGYSDIGYLPYYVWIHPLIWFILDVPLYCQMVYYHLMGWVEYFHFMITELSTIFYYGGKIYLWEQYWLLEDWFYDAIRPVRMHHQKHKRRGRKRSTYHGGCT
jgi:hypothetical protein